LKLLQKFKDDRYFLVKVLWEGEVFLYLEDREQRTESLGRLTEDADLTPYWERHLREEGFCLPCEVLLLPAEKVVRGEGAVAELGLTLERLERFKKELEEVA
jgi:hypothetical protein